MTTESGKWQALVEELLANWHWMQSLRSADRSDAILALGAGLPGKVLMSWCNPSETRDDNEKVGEGLGGNVLRPAPTFLP